MSTRREVRARARASQARHPWRATARTIAAAVVALAPLAPALVDAVGLSRAAGVGLVVITIAGAITRVLAVPGVEQWMVTHLPWLAADPPDSD